MAKLWLENNSPCTVEAYYQNVSGLMPTHIASFRTHPRPQFALCREALARLTRRGGSYETPICSVADGVITVERTSRKRKYDYSWIPSDPKVGDEIVAPFEGMEKNQREAARKLLISQGFRSVEKNVFRYNPQSVIS